MNSQSWRRHGVLSNSSKCNDLECLWRSLPYRKPLKVRYFVFVAHRAVPLHLQHFLLKPTGGQRWKSGERSFKISVLQRSVVQSRQCCRLVVRRHYMVGRRRWWCCLWMTGVTAAATGWLKPPPWCGRRDMPSLQRQVEQSVRCVSVCRLQRQVTMRQ